jgi:hypothetical protein
VAGQNALSNLISLSLHAIITGRPNSFPTRRFYLPDQGAGTFGFQRQHRCQCRTLSLRRYPRSEVEAILSAPRQPRDRVFLMTVYACGLPPIAKLVASALKWENPSTVKDRQSPNARVD